MIVGGDFNTFLELHEHEGSSHDRHMEMLDFVDTIVDFQLVDPGFTCPLFTWERESAGLHHRLARILVGEFRTSVCSHLLKSNILLELVGPCSVACSLLALDHNF